MTSPGSTRTALVAAALDLFEQNGYDATTAAAVAGRAGVTEMTFFRHFPSKADVLLADPYDPLIAEAIRDQPSSAGAVAATIGGVVAAWGSTPAPPGDEVRRRLRIVAGTPSLRGALARNSAATEAAMAEALISRGTGAADARIAAAATMGALNAALLEWAEGEDPDLGTAIAAAARVLGAS